MVSILKITLATTSLSNTLLSIPSSEALPVAPGLLFKLPHADLPPGCDSPPTLPAASSGSWSASSSIRAGENSEQGRWVVAVMEIRQAEMVGIRAICVWSLGMATSMFDLYVL